MSAGRETEHWPEIYHTANGYKVQCECGWDSKSIKGANPDEGLKVMWKEHVAALREPGADTGTTPPEGLDAGVRAALECAEYALTHPGSNQHFALTAVRHVMAELDAGVRAALECAEYALTHPGSNQHFALTAVRHVMAELDAAATQRAPVEHGRETPKPPSINANQTAAEQFHEDILSIYGARSQTALRVTCREIFERREREVLKAAAPDHAREGARASALKDACAAICNGCAQGHPIVSDPMDEEHEELHDWGFTKQPCAAWKIRKLLEEALADGKEGGE